MTDVRQFPIQAQDGPQIIPISGGSIGFREIFLAFGVAPSAGTVTIEQRAIGSSAWTPINLGVGVSIVSGELALVSDGAIGALRVSFSGLSGGVAPMLWVSDQPTAMPPIDMLTSQPNQRLRVYPGVDFDTAVGLGLVPGVRRVAALGNNPDIDTATLPEDVWSVGGIYPWMTGATALEVVSTSASDTAAGTGARSITIFGLDANYVEVVQTVFTNGATPAPIPTPLLRINTILVVSAGSAETNVGDLNIRRAPGGLIQAQVPAGYGISKQSIFTVPAGHTLSIHSILFAQTKSGGVERNVTLATFFRSVSGAYRMPLEVSVSQSVPYRHDGKPGIIAVEKTDIAIRVTSASANDISVTCAFLGDLFSVASLSNV